MGRRRGRSVGGRVTVKYFGGFNSLSLKLLLSNIPVIDSFNWHFMFLGRGGGFNYNVVPGRYLGVGRRVKVVHSHYFREGEFIHLRFFHEMSPRKALSYAVRGFMGFHRIASKRLGVRDISVSGKLFRKLRDYL